MWAGRPRSLKAGTKYRGEFEERVEALVREASQEPKPILFIDEIHLLLGAGQAGGSMDAANKRLRFDFNPTRHALIQCPIAKEHSKSQ